MNSLPEYGLAVKLHLMREKGQTYILVHCQCSCPYLEYTHLRSKVCLAICYQGLIILLSINIILIVLG